jgi:hypothetical protein
MAKLNPAVRGLIDTFLLNLEQAIVSRLGPVRGGRGAAGGRRCPAKGCRNPSAGPRNRFFCSDHARSLSRTAQDRILAAARRDVPQDRGVARIANGRRKRRGPRGPLDMRCRVASCRHASRGPRFGFICDDHRKTLGKKQQEEAREAYKARKAARA